MVTSGKAAVVTGGKVGYRFATAEALTAEGACTVFDINAAGARSAAERLGPAAPPITRRG
jgi:NAD(P)-dependent dehydrogenase (short-subunit alcohol dehydrogenase family)